MYNHRKDKRHNSTARIHLNSQFLEGSRCTCISCASALVATIKIIGASCYTCTSHCHGGRPCQNEVEHITPGRSSSNSTIEGKDEAKLISPGSAPSNSTKKDEAELITCNLEAHSINREYCSCKKDCSSSRCGCVLKGKKMQQSLH